jgi:hypothetical protein
MSTQTPAAVGLSVQVELHSRRRWRRTPGRGVARIHARTTMRRNGRGGGELGNRNGGVCGRTSPTSSRAGRWGGGGTSCI